MGIKCCNSAKCSEAQSCPLDLTYCEGFGWAPGLITWYLFKSFFFKFVSGIFISLSSTISPAKVVVSGNTLTRDTLTSNFEILGPAIRRLGLRVSVPTCQVHIGALYAFMEIPCPSLLIQNNSFHIFNDDSNFFSFMSEKFGIPMSSIKI